MKSYFFDALKVISYLKFQLRKSISEAVQRHDNIKFVN